MMRISTGLLCALAMTACSWGGSGDGGNGGGTVDAATSGSICGDGTCSADEVNTCSADCGSGSTNYVCGNGQCETSKGENAVNCAQDCNAGSGSGSGSGSATGNCPSDPSVCLACLLDATMCPQGLDQSTCTSCVLGGTGGLGSGFGSGSGSGTCNFNMVCDTGEDATSCPTDCP